MLSTGLQCCKASINLHSRSYNSTCSADSSFRASTSMVGCRLCKSPGRHYNSEHFCHIVQVSSQLSQATITSVPPASNGENYAFERSLTRSHHLSVCSGSISLPSYGYHVAQTFQLLHQLPLRNSLKLLTSDFQIHHLRKLLCRVERASEYLKHGAVFWDVACQDYVQTSFQH